MIASLAVLGACGPSADRSGDEPNGVETGDEAGSYPRAAYLTSLTFVGFEPSPSLVYLRFENRAEQGRLELSYRGWVVGRDAWNPILHVEDTIPVARAAWRVVPAGPLRMRVGSGATIESVALPIDGTPLRLEALDDISVWSGATGQRETLRSAELILGPGAESGLLLQRRRARPLSTERSTANSQAFVLTDTIGNGLIILRNRDLPDAPASVWAWLDGERIEWSDALLIALSSPEGAPGRWSIELAGEGITVEIEGALPILETSVPSGADYRLFPVRATLSVGEERRGMSGISVVDAGP